MRFSLQAVAAIVLSVAALLGSVTSVQGQTFSNAAPIAIPVNGAEQRATPYPSTISVLGVAAPIDTVSITLNGYSHTFTVDTSVMLVAPGGQRIMLMAQAGNSGPVNNLTLTFARDAAMKLSATGGVPVSGTYLPSAFSSIPAPTPAPVSPALTGLDALTSTSANGTWSLYVWDVFPSLDGGSIAGGWSITFNAPGTTRPATSSFTYQGKLENAGAPFSGTADLAFSLWDTPFSTNTANRIGSSIIKTGQPVVNGLVTVDLDFDPATLSTANLAGKALWLQVEAAVPSGGPATTLTPRQPLNPAPQAWNAQRLGGRSILELPQLTQPNTFTQPQSVELGASAVGITIRGSTTQGSTALQRWTNNSGTLLAAVGSTGAVTASDYQLTSPITRRKVIAPQAFQPFDSTVPYNTAFVLTSSAVTFAGFAAPVDLPAGATITRVLFYVRDNSAAQDLNVSAGLYSPSANSQTVLGTASSSSSTAAGIVSTVTPFTGSTTTSDGQILLLQANWNPSLSGTALGIYGARVEYTIDNVKP